jgi:phospholipid/cholesterol/gamma-HCH transport system substrate-binding protein
MRRGIKVRLIAFAILSAVGMVYVGASYLGFVDQALGRGYTVHVVLPESGGLYQGSEVTYRGVKIGKVSKMTVKGDGLKVDLALKQDARVPASSSVFVYDLSAVGEQYLSFEPKTKTGPMLQDGDTVHGTKDSLPLGEDVLMTDLSRFVSSVSGSELNTVVSELGDMFRDNATPLRSMVLLHSGRVVLQTQAENSANIHAFARDLATLTGTLAKSDADIRKILDQAGPAADELELMVSNLRKVLPPFLTHLVNVSVVLDERRDGLEQLLVTFPRLVAAGPSALTPPDKVGQKFGRVNLNLNQTPGPCTKGYLPPGLWRPTSEESFLDADPATHCDSGPPINMRGMKYAPPPNDNWKSGGND